MRLEFSEHLQASSDVFDIQSSGSKIFARCHDKTCYLFVNKGPGNFDNDCCATH